MVKDECHDLVNVPPYALSPGEVLRSVDASRDTLRKSPMRLLDIAPHASTLIGGRPIVVIGGIAQILWARKTHTDDLDLVVTAPSLLSAYKRVHAGTSFEDWALPSPPDRSLEEDRTFKVCHLLFRGAVVDFITFKKRAFNAAILRDAKSIAEFGALPVINPELLLVTHLLRPTPEAALAAVALLVARAKAGGFNFQYAEKWATYVGRRHAYEVAVRRAREFQQKP